jgi:hypothetical protein
MNRSIPGLNLAILLYLRLIDLCTDLRERDRILHSQELAKNYTVRKAPLAVAVGDFNRDGRLDFAVANSGTNNVSILLGRGNSTFQPAVAYPVNQSPKSLAVGDFNGDGKLDVVTANAGSVGVLLRNGNGTFKAAINSSGSQLFGSVAVSDSTLALSHLSGLRFSLLPHRGSLLIPPR